jgi:predicted alpha/beta-fold hydrolase
VPAAAASAGTHQQAKPTVVLVHGVWADGSSWNSVVSGLQHDGYTVDVPPTRAPRRDHRRKGAREPR